jgi:hypothetical protein
MSSDLGTIFGSGGLVISIISMVYAAINHKRIRAKCCGRSVDFEINIDPTEAAAAEEKKESGASAATATHNLQTTERRTIGADTLRHLRNLELFTKKTSKVAPEPAVIKPVALQAKPRTWVDDDVEGLADYKSAHPKARFASEGIADDQDDVELGPRR